MGVVFGGEKAWRVFAKREIVVALHWVNGEESMVLLPIRRPLGWVPFVIPMSVIPEYLNRDGYPTPEGVARCFKAADVMGLSPTRDTAFGIMTAIADHYEDLKNMPPEPPALTERKRRAVGEASLILNGETIAQAEVNDLPADIYVPDRTTH